MATKRQPRRNIPSRDLQSLLISLGFQKGKTAEEFHRIWRHPEAGTIILLPANKEDQRPLEVDLDSVRTHLYYNGHIEANEFDDFVKTGKLTIP